MRLVGKALQPGVGFEVGSVQAREWMSRSRRALSSAYAASAMDASSVVSACCRLRRWPLMPPSWPAIAASREVTSSCSCGLDRGREHVAGVQQRAFGHRDAGHLAAPRPRRHRRCAAARRWRAPAGSPGTAPPPRVPTDSVAAATDSVPAPGTRVTAAAAASTATPPAKRQRPAAQACGAAARDAAVHRGAAGRGGVGVCAACMSNSVAWQPL